MHACVCIRVYLRIDASDENMAGRFGLARYVAHSHRSPNLLAEVRVDSEGLHHLLFVSRLEMVKGTELRIDHNARREPICTLDA